MKKISYFLLMLPLLLSGCNDANSVVYTVTFDSKGGTEVETQRVKKGGKLFKPTNPTRNESEFQYWSFNGDEWLFTDNVVTQNMTLEANWAVYNDVIVHFNETEGSISGSGTYLSGNEVTITATPVNTKYFHGFYSDENFTELLTTDKSYTFIMPENDVEIYAKFRLTEEEVEWNIAHGIIPSQDFINNTLTYGLYPQTNINDETLINALNQIESPELNDWYLYEDTYYAKLTAKPYEDTYKFDNGDDIIEGNVYWFKVEPIKWKILSNVFSCFVLSSLLLDAHPYDDDSNVYHSSEIRSWLNDEFYKTSFALDSSLIVTSTVDNSAKTTDSDTNPNAGQNTNDKIFLLSYKDYLNTSFGFSSDTTSNKARECKTTDWARANGAYANGFDTYLNNGVYWTRSPISDYKNPWAVYQSGLISTHAGFEFTFVCVRPCMKIDLSSIKR